MRSFLAAVSVLVVSAALLSRQVLAEPPPAMESRELTKIIPALEKAKRRSDLAAVRFYAEVFEGTHLQAPIGSPLDTLGPWGDNGALLNAEGSLGACNEALAPEKQAKAAALLKEYGSDLPVMLRAYALSVGGDKKQAADLFAMVVEGSAAFGSCPSEHPMYSGRRTGRMAIALACVKTLDPKRDVKALEKLLQKAEGCLRNNHAVG